jgi:hypothetical protein
MSSSSDTSSPAESSSRHARFGFSATLRVMCAAERHDEIERVTGLTATHQHRQGEEGRFGRPWPSDLWTLESPRPPAAPLDDHLAWLWDQIQPHAAFFRSLAAEDGVDMDIFCGYRSDCAECGFEVTPDALTIVHALNVPLEVSVVFR